MPFLLAERARQDCARSMRAVKGNLGHSLKEKYVESEGPRSGYWHVSACQWEGG
jgi:hypothetical protein